MSEPQDVSPCPIPHAHRRLMDCHAHWHMALDEYMEPEGFRLNLNSLIQALRNVTWLLQKQKATIPGFPEWYPDWQSTVKDDDVMAWVVRARNRLVKEADLELHSVARLRVSLDWLHGGEKVFSVPPRYTSAEIAEMLVQKGASGGLAEGESALTVERRWVDRLLPDHELLAACAHAQGQLTSVVRTAHEAFGVEACDLATRSRECVGPELKFPLSCMWVSDDIRTAHFDLATLAPYTSRVGVLKFDSETGETAAERYGEFDVSGDAIERAPQMLEMGKAALARDGSIPSVVWLLRGDQLVDVQLPLFFDQAGKMLAMHTLATRAEMLNADGVALLGEIWVAPSPTSVQMRSGRFRPAREHPDRTEAVQVLAVTKDRRFTGITAPFSHEASGIAFGESEVFDEPGFLMLLRPIMRLWKIEDPESLVKQKILDLVDRYEREESGLTLEDPPGH